MIKDRLKEARTAAGLSRKELAQKVKIPYSTYTNYETGYREPRSDVLAQLAKALGVDIAYFYTDDVRATIRNLMDTIDESQERLNRELAMIEALDEADPTTLATNPLMRDAVLSCYDKLNFSGRLKVWEYVSDLVELKKYLLEASED